MVRSITITVSSFFMLDKMQFRRLLLFSYFFSEMQLFKDEIKVYGRKI